MKAFVKFGLVCSLSVFSAAAFVIGTTVAVVHHNNYSGKGGLETVGIPSASLEDYFADYSLRYPVAEVLPSDELFDGQEADGQEMAELEDGILPEDLGRGLEDDLTPEELLAQVEEPEVAESEELAFEEEIPLEPAQDSGLFYFTYRIKKDDAISKIAEAYGLDADTITSVNNIKAARRLQIGDFLKIPNQKGILYTVKKNGETPASIAKFYENDGVKAEKVALANNLRETSSLKAGETVFVPDAKMDRMTMMEINGDLYKKPLHSSYYISSRYGWRNSPFDSSKRTYHGGVDMACPTGTPIYAASEGQVTTAGWSNVYGNYVIVTHHSGYKTLYGHMSKILVSKGQFVDTSTQLGKVGSTGQSTGPHLHFTVYKNGNAVDPETLVSLR